MMKIQKMPLDKLMQQKTYAEWQQEAFRDTNLEFRNLRDSASQLRLQSSFNAYSATSLSPGNVAATAGANAMAGSYTAEVLSLASPAKMTSANAITKTVTAADTTTSEQAVNSKDIIGVAGKIQVETTAGTIATVNVTDDMTYEAVAKAIQTATAGQVPELRVNFDETTSRFFMTSKEMGAEQAFSLAFKTADGTATNEALAKQIMNDGTTTESASIGAADGSIKFNGIEITGLKTNKTTVNGITLDLLKAEEGKVTTINVQSNPEKPMEMIKAFVEDYNKTISEIEKQLVKKRYPDFQPLSDEQKKDMSENEVELWEEKARSGLLRNDPILKGAMQELRRAFMGAVEGIPRENINVLSEIGINTGSYTEGGKLFIDEDKLNAAFTNNPEEVMELFTRKDAAGNGVGIGDKVYAGLNDIVARLGEKAGTPTGTVDNSNLSKKIKQMDQDISRWQDRLTRIEDRYWKQFTAMEKAISQMNSQSTWMQQNMFGGM
ncbi:flagellar filament capping protein FliD [Planococcus sp. X10-3]|uniref:flagellar filament capping protein FliD n=1 Tax=Planococcus sp. X10-3 TaxID=3061240 RepID=UPI003BB098D4